MSSARSPSRGHKRLLPFVEYAASEGWSVTGTQGGHLNFSKPGLPSIYTCSAAGDHRAELNAKALLRRAQRQCHGGQDG